MRNERKCSKATVSVIEEEYDVERETGGGFAFCMLHVFVSFANVPRYKAKLVGNSVHIIVEDKTRTTLKNKISLHHNRS